MISVVVGVVRALWRYPVKSMLGECCESLTLDPRGVVGDRVWAIRTAAGKFGSGKTTRRFQRIEGLLAYRAVYDGEVPVITDPDGRRIADVRLSVRKPTGRCVMVTMAQSELPDDARVLRVIAEDAGSDFGIYADVTAHGRLRVGDAVTLVPAGHYES